MPALGNRKKMLLLQDIAKAEAARMILVPHEVGLSILNSPPFHIHPI